MQNNMSFAGVQLKGIGLPNGIPSAVDRGMYTLGGFQDFNDLGGNAYFGYMMSSSPNGADGSFFVGIPSGYVMRGIVVYDGGIAQNDPAKPDYVLQGVPLTLQYKGSIWLSKWGLLAPGAINPVIGCAVIVNNTTGEIEFMPRLSSAPTGWTLISSLTVNKGAKVVSVSADTSGALISLLI